MPNDLTRFITQRRGCDSITCGTCGGYLRFLGELESFLHGRSDLVVLLRGVRDQDVLRLPVNGRDLPPLLRRLSAEERDAVIRSWQKGIARIPAFAEGLLGSIGEYLASNPVLKREILGVLLPVALNEDVAGHADARRTRDVLEQVLGAELETNEQFMRARKSDRRMDEYRVQQESTRSAAREQARLDAKEAVRRRDERIAQLDALTFVERLELIATDRTGVAKPLPRHWADLSHEDILRLPSELRLALQRRLDPHRRGPWRRLRGLLHAQNSREHAADRATLISHLSTLPPLGQLSVFAASHVPVPCFPATLAAWGLENIHELPTPLREGLKARLASIRKGPWSRLHEVIAAADGRPSSPSARTDSHTDDV